MSARRACCSAFASPARLRAASPVISYASSPTCHSSCARPSPSTTAPSSPVIWRCIVSRSRPSSAILTHPGRRAASRTPSEECVASSPARPTWRPCPPPGSENASLPTTTPRANALTTEPLRSPLPVNCCTSSVNPPPGFRQDDSEYVALQRASTEIRRASGQKSTVIDSHNVRGMPLIT